MNLVFGATGLIGHAVLELLPKNQSTVAFTRKPLNGAFLNIISDLSERALSGFHASEQVDSVFCCLGTTIKTAGSREQFYHVDHDLVVNVARMAVRVKAKRLLIVSAIGSDVNSKVFYSRTKGEMERDVLKVAEGSATQVIFFHPSLLLGDRKKLNQPARTGEGLAIRLAPVLNLLCVGPLKKYRPIAAEEVARQMLHSAI